MKRALITLLSVLLVDQGLKIWVKLNMFYDEFIPVIGNWFIIQFVENPGMAFGYEFGGEYGKILLTLFRIAAVSGIAWYIHKQIKLGAKPGYVIALSLILAGAVGNIIDSAIYGVIFSDSTQHMLATAFPEGGGYGTFLHGNVVDMLYFPIITLDPVPDWVPFIGGDRNFVFFRPIFNVADMAITVGVLMILFWQKRYFATPKAV